MVESYNNFIQLSNYLTGEKSDDDELAGSLAGEKGTVNLVKNRIRGIIGQHQSRQVMVYLPSGIWELQPN